ncbi:hypothetical protein LIER_33332 [Lithospermum erythrorhizon]|uniref:Uncharacterized protein n=1 Tax=Lithospermum erythrorhizon TaxID=34254 RepID=A0AAV3RYL7_LITER
MGAGTPIRTTVHTCHPPQSKEVRLDFSRCGCVLSPEDFVRLRARFRIPLSMVMQLPQATKRALTPAPGMRTIFVAALENGLRFPPHLFVTGVLTLVGVCPTQLTPNSELVLTAFSHRTQDDSLLYFCTNPSFKHLCSPHFSKLDPEI